MAPVDNPLDVFFDLVPTGAALYAPLYDGHSEVVDFRFVRLNPAGQRLLGLPAQPPHTFREYYPHSVPTGIFAQYRAAYLTGQTSTYDVSYAGDGLDTYFRLVAQRSGDLLVVNFTDLADLPRSGVEQALRDSQAREQAARAEAEAERQRFYEVLMQLPASVTINRGLAHIFDLVNPRYQQLFHNRRLLGLPLREALPELQGQGIIEKLDQVYATGEAHYAWEQETWVDRTDTGRPERRYYNVLFQPLRDAHGRVDGLLNFAYDVTGHVEAREQQLQFTQTLETRVQERTRQLAAAQAATERQRHQWEEVFLHAPAAISIYDGPEWVYEFVNPVYQALFPDRVLLGRPLLEALPELHGQPLVDILHRVYDTGEPFVQSAVLVPLARTAGAPLEDRYFDLSYQARTNEAGQITGLMTYVNDVTAQVLARREREAQQGELQRIFEQAPVAIAVFRGPAHTIELANELQLAIWDRTREQALGKGLFELLPEVAAQGFEQILTGVMATGQPYVGIEAPASFTRHGVREEIFVSFVHHPLREADGRISGVVAVITDTTEQVRARRRVEQLNQELEARVAERTQRLAAAQAAAERERRELARVFEQAPVGIAVFRGPTYTIELANPTLARLWGRTREQLLGKDVYEAMPEAAGLGYEELMDGVMATGVPYEAHGRESRHERNGRLETLYWDFVYVPMYAADGHINGMLVVATDTTAQVLAHRQVEQLNQELETRVAERTRQLTEQQALLRQILGHVPAYIATLSGPKHRYTFFNELYQQLAAGRTVLGRGVADVLPEAAEQGFLGLLDQVYTTGAPFVGRAVPLQLHEPAAARPPVQYLDFVYQPLVDGQGHTTGILLFAINVTEQVLAHQLVEASQLQVQQLNEELLAANQELLDTNRRLTRTNVDLDTFVYTASHDLKAPITNIEAISLALQDHLPVAVQADEVIGPLLRLLQGAAERFRLTINQLTDVSRLQHAQNQPTEQVHLAAVVEDVRLDLLPALQAAEAQLIVDVDPALVVLFAPKNLRSVVYNLLSNALKYHRPGQAPVVTLRATRAAAAVVLTVQDAGLGLTEAQQRRLFGLFQRLHTHVEGTGIGLYMVKRMVENAGGTITVQSQSGVGTTFSVSLPA